MNNGPIWPDNAPATPPVAPEARLPSPPMTPGAPIEIEGPSYVEQSETLRSGFRVGQLVALLIGLAFLGGVGALAIAGFSGNRSGAESPEAAVEALSLALSNEDVIAALEIMAPSEVGTASQLYPRLIDLAVQEGELQSADWLAGVDFTVTGLETRTEQLHSGVALVELVSGTIEVTVDPDVADPMFLDGPLTERITIEEMREEMTAAIDEASSYEDDLFTSLFPFTIVEPQGIFIMTVKRNGGWFVSPLYTAAEYGRQLLDLPPADFSASRERANNGAATARDVVDDFVAMVNNHTLDEHVDAALSGDPDGVFDAMAVLVPPDEAGVFLDYASSYTALVEGVFGEMSMEDIRQEMQQAAREVDLRGQLTLDIDVRETLRDDGAVVLYLESGSLRIDAGITDPEYNERSQYLVDVSWNGLCGRAELSVNGVPEESVSDCVPDDVVPAAYDEVFVVVGEVDGDWYVSYVETALAYAEIYLEDELN